MEFSSVTETAFFSASVLSFVLTLAFIYQALKNRLLWIMATAAFFQTVWLLSIAIKHSFSTDYLSLLLLTESAHYVLWLLSVDRSTERFCGTRLPLFFKVCVYFICATSLGLACFNYLTESLKNIEEKLIIWQGIAFPIISLLSIEQLYRNNTQYRLFKLICLALAIVYVFDAYLFTQHLLFAKLDSDLWQARAAVSMASSVLMVLAVATMAQPSQSSAKLTFSRPVIFYTTSLTLAGAFLMALSIGGYYVRIYGGNWGTIIYTLLSAAGLFFIGFIFSSSDLRRKLSVLINKHLFSYKYDYRTEWLKLINQLSQPTSTTDTATRAITVAADLFNCHGGALWLLRSNVMVPVRQINTQFDISEVFEPETSPFCEALKDEWVFAPNSNTHDLGLNNKNLPLWMNQIPDAWLVFPLLTEKDLVGFMVLVSPKEHSLIGWEDLDLSKTVGRQIASYLARHEQAELLAESRQFDAFNKLSAFVMHDLKNLIAQQSLVVKNAEKHKDNPAFVEDAIHTIKNSVERMNNLLRKLQRNEEGEEVKVLHLKDIFIEAIKRCQKRPPVPTLVPFKEDLQVKGDFDSLVMVFTHILHNAQDATPNHGFVDISTILEDDTITVTIEDNGEGMDKDFINNKLFKPFETTKSGKGMGVGVYQAREYIQSLGGNISVESSLGEGTTFIISLPAN
ncbi:XrtA/PEP-CTERM system histidine kinase PrsK [Agarilytica rhodophyticola]|uniref:XrtA/PEP-CTERM system histidine kinase PrsK n=1 Tax=Agarilytica rhodophyticola TaxID=1737490 RepID=UPI000B343D88|nr:XrtA/PEP-CTERM system histidine kinase PrsK [Agarilytica rhodophyticola]